MKQLLHVGVRAAIISSRSHVPVVLDANEDLAKYSAFFCAPEALTGKLMLKYKVLDDA